MIDLHCHLLPGIDDGAQDMSMALAMAKAAAGDGVHTIAATPHLNPTYPLDPAAIEDAVERVRFVLDEEDVPVSVRTGAELAVTSIADLDDEDLGRTTLGGGDCLLVECPYVSGVPFFEEMIFGLQLRGFRPLLAHPERSPMFQRAPDRLASLVARGALCSITAGSMRGLFGERVRKFTIELLREGLVHDVASDAHDPSRRPPGLSAGFLALEAELPGIGAQMPFFTEEGPSAILAGRPLPPRPRALTPRPSGWRRLLPQTRPAGAGADG